MDWYVTGYDPKAEEAHGWADFSPGDGEFGLFTLAELRETHANIRLANPAGPDIMIPLAIQRDAQWKPRTIRSILTERGGIPLRLAWPASLPSEPQTSVPAESSPRGLFGLAHASGSTPPTRSISALPWCRRRVVDPCSSPRRRERRPTRDQMIGERQIATPDLVRPRSRSALAQVPHRSES